MFRSYGGCEFTNAFMRLSWAESVLRAWGVRSAARTDGRGTRRSSPQTCVAMNTSRTLQPPGPQDRQHAPICGPGKQWLARGCILVKIVAEEHYVCDDAWLLVALRAALSWTVSRWAISRGLQRRTHAVNYLGNFHQSIASTAGPSHEGLPGPLPWTVPTWPARNTQRQAMAGTPCRAA
eukprot:scaffold686_cov342-Prasinococcus_capsulatus_cf.AAC.3